MQVKQDHSCIAWQVHMDWNTATRGGCSQHIYGRSKKAALRSSEMGTKVSKENFMIKSIVHENSQFKVEGVTYTQLLRYKSRHNTISNMICFSGWKKHCQLKIGTSTHSSAIYYCSKYLVLAKAFSEDLWLKGTVQ